MNKRDKFAPELISQLCNIVSVSHDDITKLQLLKVGDVVLRDMGGIEMKLKVTKITDTKIICGSWEFDKNTSLEIDEDISFPASYIKSIQ